MRKDILLILFEKLGLAILVGISMLVFESSVTETREKHQFHREFSRIYTDRLLEKHEAISCSIEEYLQHLLREAGLLSGPKSASGSDLVIKFEASTIGLEEIAYALGQSDSTATIREVSGNIAAKMKKLNLDTSGNLTEDDIKGFRNSLQSDYAVLNSCVQVLLGAAAEKEYGLGIKSNWLGSRETIVVFSILVFFLAMSIYVVGFQWNAFKSLAEISSK